MEQMFNHELISPAPWRRIVRYDASGNALDWVDVGQCLRCGRGVDRDVPAEYRLIAGRLFCRACAALIEAHRAVGATVSGPPAGAARRRAHRARRDRP